MGDKKRKLEILKILEKKLTPKEMFVFLASFLAAYEEAGVISVEDVIEKFKEVNK